MDVVGLQALVERCKNALVGGIGIVGADGQVDRQILKAADALVVHRLANHV